MHCRGLLRLGWAMAITVERASSATMDDLAVAVASWQENGTAVQVHPGDFGWNCSFGIRGLVDSLRVWRQDGYLVAAGMVDDEAGLLRMAISPSAGEDQSFAERFVDDLSDPARGVLPAERGLVEVRCGDAVRNALSRAGWRPDEPWTPLVRDLSVSVEHCGLRIERIDAQHIRDDVVRDRIAVHRESFANSTFSLDRWQAMAASPFYRNARCLVAYDPQGHAVAATTVWSAGVGRPGLIEPLGAHSGYRGRGYGRAITRAAAAELQSMGAASVGVCTPASNVAGIAAYVSGGFTRLEPMTDFRRPT